MVSIRDEAIRLYGWAYKIGLEVKKMDRGEDLLKRLLYDIRGESLPGRFREVLIENLMYLFDTKELGYKKIPKSLLEKGVYGDKFHYIKAAILMGFMDALATSDSGGGSGSSDDSN